MRTLLAKLGLTSVAVLFVVLTLPSFVAPSSQTVSAAGGVCQKQYNAWNKAGESERSKTYKPMIDCIMGVAANHCKGKNLEDTNKSEAARKQSCLGWYRVGFEKRGSTCDSTRSAQNGATCRKASQSRTTYVNNIPGGSGESGSDDSGSGSGGEEGGDEADSDPAEPLNLGSTRTDYKCGGEDTGSITTAINFGCKGKGNALVDLMFAIIRFLSNGVGLVIIASLIWGGIQYSSSRGDPQATAAAVNRFKAVFVALMIYAFTYAIVNYLIPGQLLQ